MRLNPSSLRRWLLLLCALLATFTALHLRLQAVAGLGIDYDEDDYLAAGQRYAAAIRKNDLPAIINYEFNYEHPPLTKLVYGLVTLPLPESIILPERPSTDPPRQFMPQAQFKAARLSSATFGALQAGALALLNPAAGMLLAIHTWQIKYTSQIMLEPLPALTSLLAVLFYVEARKRRRFSGYLWLSAAMLGLTAAGKYTYAIIGLAMLADWLWASAPQGRRAWQSLAGWRSWLGPALAWGLLSLVVFFAFNPRLWHDPLGRLSQSLLFHGDYAVSEHVQNAGYPAWQPLVWLTTSVPWQTEVFTFRLDLLISLLALAGLARLWRKQRVFALWFWIGLVFLLLWPTKWPQYILTITAPLCLAAAEGLSLLVWEPLRDGWQNWRRKDPAQPAEPPANRKQTLQALPWLLPGTLVLVLITFYPLVFQAGMALTDFNAMSIRDGMQGGVWRAVWEGLSGTAEAKTFDIFRGVRSLQVGYAGPGVLQGLFSGEAADLLLFNVFWTVTTVGLQAAVGVSAALLLHQRGLKLRRWWQAVLILPWAIPEFVGGLVWLRLFDHRGGWLLLAAAEPGVISLPAPLQNPAQALPIMLAAATWLGFPFLMVAALAGLKLIPDEVYDAAAMDGAGGWQLFRHITWPLLLPLLTPMLIIRSIFAFNQFYLFYTLNPPFPLMTFATLSYWFFMPTSRFGGQFAVSAAINIFTVVLLLGMLAWFNRFSKAAEGVTYV